jgi:hypothetical protein
MERVNGPQSSPRGNNNGLTNNEATILQEEQASIRSIGKAHGRQFLKRPQIDKLTSHGNLRSQQRLPSQNEIDCAVSSAIRSGKINRQKGKYGTLSITTKAITD